MTTVAAEVLQWGWERARAGPWRGDGRIAYLAPLAPAGTPSADFLQRCLDALAARGFEQVVTSALAPAEQPGFKAVGFETYERLHLLSHALDAIPAMPEVGVGLRRGRSADWPAAIEVDAGSFSPFWRLDADGLREAIEATPASRFRVASARRNGPVLAYAVTGLSAKQGYLQRLAVHPDHRNRGLGRALAVDGLRWLRRKAVSEAVVNTQLGNEAALRLYLSLGFREEPIQLAVLHRWLP